MGAGYLRNGIKVQYFSIRGALQRRQSIADSFGSPISRTTQHHHHHHHHQHQQQQSKAYARLPHSIYSKPKNLELPAGVLSAPFCTASSSSASKIAFVEWYLGMIKSHPVLTKSITSGFIFTAADFSSQTIARSSSEPYDLVRTLRMAGYGMIFSGTSLHFWFNFVSRVLPKRDVITTLKKIIMGQLLYGPVMTVIFFSLNAGLQGENGTEIIARLKRDFVPTIVSGVLYWPFCDFVTFKFIPVHLQPLVSNSFSYLWNVYLTYMASLDKAETK